MPTHTTEPVPSVTPVETASTRHFTTPSTLIALLRRLHRQLVEERLLGRITVTGPLGMPLHPNQPTFHDIGTFYSFYRPVRCTCTYEKPGSQLVDGLMVEAPTLLDDRFPTDRFGQQRPRIDVNGVHRLAFGRVPVFSEPGLSGDVLVERPAKRNVQDLHPPADGEKRFPHFKRRFRQCQLQRVGVWLNVVHVRVPLLPEEGRVHVATAHQDEAVDAREIRSGLGH